MTSLSAFFLAAVMMAGAAPSDADADADAYQRSYDQEARGDARAALETMASLSAGTTDSYVAVLRVGWLSYLAGDHRESVAAYKRAITLEPRAIEAKLGLTLPLVALRLWQDALDVTDQILKADPKNFLGRSRRAWCLYSLGRYPQAEAAYRDILIDYPADQDLRAGLAWSLLQQGKTQDALAEVKRVLEVAPRHPSALDAHARLGH